MRYWYLSLDVLRFYLKQLINLKECDPHTHINVRLRGSSSIVWACSKICIQYYSRVVSKLTLESTVTTSTHQRKSFDFEIAKRNFKSGTQTKCPKAGENNNKKKKRSVTKICFAIEQKQQKTHKKKYRKECSKSKRSDSNKTVNKIFGFHQFFAAFWFVSSFAFCKGSGPKVKRNLQRLSKGFRHNVWGTWPAFSVVLSLC